jgi:hypothetical protein
MRDFYERTRLFAARVEPGETRRFEIKFSPGQVFFSNGPSVRVSSAVTRRATINLAHNDCTREGELDAAPASLTCCSLVRCLCLE